MDDASQGTRPRAAKVNMQGGEARHIARTIGHNRKPEIDVESLEVALPRPRRRDCEPSDHAQGRHALPNGVLSGCLSKDS